MSNDFVNDDCYGCDQPINYEDAEIKIVGRLWETYPENLLFHNMGCFQNWQLVDHHQDGECPNCEKLIQEGNSS